MLLGYIWLLGTFVNSSCDVKINVNIVQNCCRNLAVRGLIDDICMAVLVFTLVYLEITFFSSVFMYLQVPLNEYDFTGQKLCNVQTQVSLSTCVRT